MNHTGRLIVSIKGPFLTSEERTMLAHPMIIGVILFSENYVWPTNYKDKVQLQELICDITQSADKTCFVDQEGGYIQRFGRGFKSLPSVSIFGEIYNWDPGIAKKMAYDYGATMAGELMEFGIISLAPVCDIDGGNTVISRINRAFHKDPQICLELITSFIDGMNSCGMAATGKHFPGHGSSIGDSHNVAVTDNRTLDELEHADLSIFIELIKAQKLSALMPAHILYPQVDPDHTAGASKIWLQDLLRQKYGYDGIIISDCLSMVAAGTGTMLEKAKQALSFGDVAILCHQEPATILQLCDELSTQGFGMSSKARQRYLAWTSGADSIRRQLAKQTALA